MGNIDDMGESNGSDLSNMIKITTVNIRGETAESTATEAQDIVDVADTLAKLGITSEYRATLAWDSTADLDIYVQNVETAEIIYWSKKVSSDGYTSLDVDNRGGATPEEGEKWVENVSFNGDVAGTYAVYVNNYDRKSEADEIRFTVVTKVGDQTQAFDDSWDINEKGDNPGEDMGKMMKISTITIGG